MKVNDVLGLVTAYLNETIATHFIIFTKSNDPAEIVKLSEMLIDIRFQTDFTLISSSAEIQEIYDKYRNRPAGESNSSIRLLMDLSTYIKMSILDEDGDVGYTQFIVRLIGLLTFHSNVESRLTCQDDSITDTIDDVVWHNLLINNPWLVAMVCIRLIPSYYIVDMAIVKLTDMPGVIHETLNPD